MQTYCENPPTRWLAADDYDALRHTLTHDASLPKALQRMQKITAVNDDKPLFTVVNFWPTDEGTTGANVELYCTFLTRGIAGVVVADRLVKFIKESYKTSDELQYIYGLQRADMALPNTATATWHEGSALIVKFRTKAGSNDVKKQTDRFFKHLEYAIDRLRPN